jgi:hypothetical protein
MVAATQSVDNECDCLLALSWGAVAFEEGAPAEIALQRRR